MAYSKLRLSRISGLAFLLVPALLFVCLLVFSKPAAATPLLSEPKFVQLSTEQGLSQDTVRSMLIDQEGFLWIGTDGGLNRYDGYRVELVKGPNQELSDVPVYNLFQDSQGDLWIGTLAQGLYKYDLQENVLQLMGDWRFKQEPDWLQDASHFIEPEQGTVYVAMNQQIVRFNSEGSEVVFQLDDELLLEQHAIRHIWSDNEILLIATTIGVYGLELATQRVVKLDHLGNLEENRDNRNSKYLLYFQETLWIATVEGLFSAPFADVKAFVLGDAQKPQVKSRIKDLNIWNIRVNADNHFYLATNKGMYTFWPQEDQLQHLFQLTDSRYYLTDNNIVDMIANRNGNIWMATLYDGALLWSPNSMRFTNIVKNDSPGSLSASQVFSLHQQDESRLWVGTNNGLNLYKLEEGEIDSFLVNSDEITTISESSIFQVYRADEQHLWLLNTEGLTKFNTESKKEVPVVAASESDRELISGDIWNSLKDKQGNIWFYRDEGVFKFDVKTGKVTPSELINEQLDLAEIQLLLPDYQESSDSFLVAAKGFLYRYKLR